MRQEGDLWGNSLYMFLGLFHAKNKIKEVDLWPIDIQY